MKDFKQIVSTKTMAVAATLVAISNTAFAASTIGEKWTLAKKLEELGEWFISDVALPIGVLVVIGLGIAIMKGNAGQFTGQAIKVVAGLTLIVAAASIAAWIIGK